MKKHILPLLLAALLVLGCTGKTNPSVSNEPTAAPVQDTAAPEQKTQAPEQDATASEGADSTAAERTFRFSTTDIDGNAIDDSVFEGYDLIMLNFWAYWCGPCVQELPELQKLQEQYPNLLLLGVIVDNSDMAETRAVIERAGAKYRMVYPDGDLMELAAKCMYIPTTYFLRADGTILGEPTVGSNSLEQWSQIVEDNLK